MRISKGICLLIATLMIFLTACKSNPQKALVGTWIGHYPQGQAQFQFFPDGSVTLTFDGVQTQAGTYTLPDASNVRIDGMFALSGVYAFEGSGICNGAVCQQLTLRKGQEQVVLYRK